MTFEQWAAEMKKGLSLRKDEKPKAYELISSWDYNRFEEETEEENLTSNPSQHS